MKPGRLVPISSCILTVLLNFQAARNIVRRELHNPFQQGQDAELTWVWLLQSVQFWEIWESGTRHNGRTYNCVPFMSWSAPHLSSFLLPSPEMLPSGALLKDDLFTHILFYLKFAPYFLKRPLEVERKINPFLSLQSSNTRTIQAVLAVNGQSKQ